MHQNIVEVPEIDVRQILGEDLLDFGIESLALVLVEFGAPDRSTHPLADWK